MQMLCKGKLLLECGFRILHKYAYICKGLPTFWRTYCLHFQGFAFLNPKDGRTCETSVINYESTRHHNLKGHSQVYSRVQELY